MRVVELPFLESINSRYHFHQTLEMLEVHLPHEEWHLPVTLNSICEINVVYSQYFAVWEMVYP